MLQLQDNKELIVIGGPNGSGKTTLALELLEEELDGFIYLSADQIAYELNAENPLQVRLRAGKEFFRRLDKATQKEQNLLIESTLAGKSLLNHIQKFQAHLDYTVSILFIFLDSEQTSLERIQTRVKKGGHPVPEEDVIRRFGRSVVNFWNRYRRICDRWMLYYNTEESFEEVAGRQDTQLVVYNDNLFNTYKNLVSKYGQG